MALRFKNFVWYVVSGFVLSALTLVLSALGSTRKSEPAYTNMNNPLEVPTAQADVPGSGTPGDTYNSDDCDGSGDCE